MPRHAPRGTAALFLATLASGCSTASLALGEPVSLGPARPAPDAQEVRRTVTGAADAEERSTFPAQRPETPRPVDRVAVVDTDEREVPVPRSERLGSGLFDPMPGGVLAGYRADTGLDIASSPRSVFAVAAGRLDYSELGHTLWVGKGDTQGAIRI